MSTYVTFRQSGSQFSASTGEDTTGLKFLRLLNHEVAYVKIIKKPFRKWSRLTNSSAEKKSQLSTHDGPFSLKKITSENVHS